MNFVDYKDYERIRTKLIGEFVKMKIPKMLEDYLEETEQDADEMSNAELFEEARWVLSQYNVGEYYNDMYSTKDVAALKRFITRISGTFRRTAINE